MQLGGKEFCNRLLFNTIGPKFLLFLNQFCLPRVEKINFVFQDIYLLALYSQKFATIGLIDLMMVVLLEFG